MRANWIIWSVLVSGACVSFACGDDDTSGPPDAGESGSSGNGGHGGKGGSAGNAGKGGTGPRSGAGGEIGGHGGNGASGGDVDRGRYLVEHVAACGDCHTPRKQDGSPDTTKMLSGVDCFIDVAPTDDNAGCLSSRNLTNDETGLKNRSDQEIKDMLTKGVRPADSGDHPDALHPVMPYYVFANMNDGDVNAIVAFLRTVKGVEHRVKARQAPFNIDTPAPSFPEDKIPKPADNYSDKDSAMRGRYLAGNVGICLECHTARDDMGAIKVDKAFQGGEDFQRDQLGLPPIFPATIYSSNITPDAHGIKGWTVKNIVDALKKGVDENNSPLCPPMPAGPMGAFGGLTDGDATDIANYLLSIPAGDNMVPADCMAMPPNGDMDGGVDAG